MDVNLPRDKTTGKTRGFGFLMYEDQRSTVLAVDNLNGAQVLERTLRVDHVNDYKQPKEQGEDGEMYEREEQSLNVKPLLMRGTSFLIIISLVLSVVGADLVFSGYSSSSNRRILILHLIHKMTCLTQMPNLYPPPRPLTQKTLCATISSPNGKGKKRPRRKKAVAVNPKYRNANEIMLARLRKRRGHGKSGNEKRKRKRRKRVWDRADETMRVEISIEIEMKGLLGLLLEEIAVVTMVMKDVGKTDIEGEMTQMLNIDDLAVLLVQIHRLGAPMELTTGVQSAIHPDAKVGIWAT